MSAKRQAAAFTIVEIVIVVGIVSLLIASVLGLVANFMSGFNRGEQQYSQLREAGVLLDGLRDDVENLLPDPTRNDWGLQVTSPTQLQIAGSRHGVPYQVSYAFLSGTGIVQRTVPGESPMNLGGGLINDCHFTFGGMCQGSAAALSLCSGGPDLKRIYLVLDVTIQPDSASSQWLKFRTYMFPTWANRRLTSVWNR